MKIILSEIQPDQKILTTDNKPITKTASVIKIDNPYQKKTDPRKDLGNDMDDDMPF